MEIDDQSPPPLENVMSQRKSRWPLVFGVIAIVFGAFGLLGALSAPFLGQFSVNQVDAMREAGMTVPPEVVNDYKVVVRNNAIAGGFLAVLLLVGGILLLKRRPVAPLLLQIWSVLKITVGGYMLVSSLGPSNAFSKLSMGASLDGADAQQADMVNSIFSWMEKAQLIFGLIWLSALPVIILIWMNRAPIKKQIAEWGADQAAA